MNIDYFEELLKKPTIFKDESKLEVDFIPERLPHREKELVILSQLFLALLTNPNKISRKILITGKIGIGKTVTIKVFGDMLIKAGKRRDINIKYIHINCRKERKSYKVLIKIIRELNSKFPKRGYSTYDLLDIIFEIIEKRNLHLLIILDELSYLLKEKEDLIYLLTRINDDNINLNQRLSIIGIVRDISTLNNLDNSTLSTLQKNILKFNNYSKKQIFDILKYRASLSIKENVIQDKILYMITDIVAETGDIRQGLNLLWRAGKIAEQKGLNFIDAECVRIANQEFIPFHSQDIIKYMAPSKLIFLLSIVFTLKKHKKTYVSLNEILENYYILCESLNFKARSYSQLWNYLNEFNNEQIISINYLSKKIKGRKALIKIFNIPLLKLERSIIGILNSQGFEI
ncbi:MAG: Cdc6/Cdc18 family protein [Promethearchaeota archaeon]